MYNHQLDALIKAAETGSFSKAANAMFISTPAFIQQINLLEERCGLKLFSRSNHGVKLTPAGRSLYEDAKTIIRLSQEALQKARRISESSETTVRIGTSLLFKCRMFPDIWSKVSARCPNLRVEILPISEHANLPELFSDLGIRYDLIEGVCGSAVYEGICQFLELQQTPLCCAVSRDHRLFKAREVTMEDLKDEWVMMPVEGVSHELDAFRRELRENYPAIQIVDSPYYGVDTFALCEVKPYVLITQQVYADIHPNLRTIPLNTSHTLPYGLMYSSTLSAAAKAFLDAVRVTQMANRER